MNIMYLVLGKLNFPVLDLNTKCNVCVNNKLIKEFEIENSIYF